MASERPEITVAMQVLPTAVDLLPKPTFEEIATVAKMSPRQVGEDEESELIDFIPDQLSVTPENAAEISSLKGAINDAF